MITRRQAGGDHQEGDGYGREDEAGGAGMRAGSLQYCKPGIVDMVHRHTTEQSQAAVALALP